MKPGTRLAPSLKIPTVPNSAECSCTHTEHYAQSPTKLWGVLRGRGDVQAELHHQRQTGLGVRICVSILVWPSVSSLTDSLNDNREY